jgi:iron complex transport system permease protein
MSFVAKAGKRVTGPRLAATLGVCLAIAAVIGVLVPLVGVGLDRDGRYLQLLPLDAYTAGSAWHEVVMTARLPRALASLLVGGALAGAGCALQALLRNPLAEPFTLGISSASSLGAVLAIQLGVEGALGGSGIGLGALIGAVAALLAVVQLARTGKHLPPATLILAGVAVSMWCSAITVLIQHTSDFTDVRRMLHWMVGALDGMRLESVSYAAPPIGLGLVVLVAYARELNALAAGPEAAASLGVAVARTQFVVFAVASLLVGAAIALAGPIGFIGLIVPHVLRALIGADHRLLLPASVLGGGVLLALCDTLARTLLAPGDLLPTGALTAALGGPFFLVILVGHKRRAAMWGRS